MSFWNDPAYSSMRMIVIILIIAAAGVFAYSSYQKGEGNTAGKVISVAKKKCIEYASAEYNGDGTCTITEHHTDCTSTILGTSIACASSNLRNCNEDIHFDGTENGTTCTSTVCGQSGTASTFGGTRDGNSCCSNNNNVWTCCGKTGDHVVCGNSGISNAGGSGGGSSIGN